MIGNSKMKSFRLVRLMRLAKLGQYSCQLVKHTATTRRFVNGKISQICKLINSRNTWLPTPPTLFGCHHPFPLRPPTSLRR